MPGLMPARARMSDWRGSLRWRLLVGTLVWIGVSVAVAGWGLARLFEQHVEQQFQIELTGHLNQLAANLGIDATGQAALAAALSDPRFARPYSGLYWQVDAMSDTASTVTDEAMTNAGDTTRVGLLRSRSLWDAVLIVPRDALVDGELHAHRVDGPDGQPLRMIEQVLQLADTPDQPMRLIVAANEALIDDPVARFSNLLALALGVLAAGLVAAAVVQVRVGLQPLSRLQQALSGVREGRSKAIDGRFPTEIQPLVDDFNEVLVRNADIVERARTQAGNLAHAVKTPLTVLGNAAAGEDSALARLVAEQVALARSQVDYHLARSRAAGVTIPGQKTAVAPVIEGLVRLMTRVHAGRELSIVLVACPTALVFCGESQDLQEMLGNLLDNACKWATRRVEVRASAAGAELCVVFDDDGPGLPPETRLAMFARGARADEQTPGSGLGLAIVRDLSHLYGGAVELHSSPFGGLRVSLRLPGA